MEINPIFSSNGEIFYHSHYRHLVLILNLGNRKQRRVGIILNQRIMDDVKSISKLVLESKVIDYEALGKTVAKLGPQLALMDDQWENFCGTMKYYIRIFRLPPFGPRVPDLDRLKMLDGLDSQL